MTGRAELSSYAVSYLVDHLVLAERFDGVHELLAKETQSGSAWYALKQEADDDQGYGRDLALAWQLADRRFRAAKTRGQRAEAVALQVRYCLISAALDALSDRLTPDQLRRSVRTGTWSPARARAAAARASDPALRAELFAVLIGVGSAADVRAVLELALADRDRDAVLPALAARLRPKLQTAVLAAARATGDEEVLAAAVEATAPRVGAGEVEPLLREATRLSSRAARARVVVALAPRAPARLVDWLVLESGLLDDGDVLPALLAAQGARLSRAGAAQALEALRRLPPSARRTEAAVVLIARLPAGDRNAALRVERRAARGIRAASARAGALAELGAPAEAVKAVAALSAARRGAVIAEIAPRLTPAAARTALGLVARTGPVARGTTLVALAPRLEPDAGVLKLTAAVPQRARALALVRLAPRLPEALVPQALDLALGLYDEPLRTAVADAIRQRRDTTATPAEREAQPPSPDTAPRPAEDVEWDATGLDGEALRARLVAVSRAEQADYAALRDWLVRTTAGKPSRGALKATLAAALAGADSAAEKATWARATVDRLLRERLRARAVDLGDPRVQAALEHAKPVVVRTALHLGLEAAERHGSDDELIDDSAALADVVAVFARHGRLPEALQAAHELDGPYRRAEAFAAALPYVAEAERAAVVAAAGDSLVRACRSSSPRMWWRRLDVLETLARELGRGALRQLATELRRLGERYGSDVPPGDARRSVIAEAQLVVMMHATPQVAATVAKDALKLARADSEGLRGAVLAAFAPQLPVAALEPAAALAGTFAGHTRAQALAAVARRADRVRAKALASRMIEEVAGLPDVFADPRIAAVVGEHAKLLTPAALTAVWCPEVGAGLLRDTHRASREDVERALAGLSGLLVELGGRPCVRAAEQARETVARWWP
jgi:hypothetical protein